MEDVASPLLFFSDSDSCTVIDLNPALESGTLPCIRLLLTSQLSPLISFSRRAASLSREAIFFSRAFFSVT